MCASEDCPVQCEPPAGEGWCVYRLGLELARSLFGYPMACGPPRLVALPPLP